MSLLDDIIDGTIDFIATTIWIGIIIIFACLYFGMFAYPLLG